LTHQHAQSGRRRSGKKAIALTVVVALAAGLAGYFTWRSVKPAQVARSQTSRRAVSVAM